MLLAYIKAFHVIAIIAWMAGLLYLPRLFVYHAASKKGSEQSETFKVMERRLLRLITTPAMLASWALGLILAFSGVIDWSRDGWFHGIKRVFRFAPGLGQQLDEQRIVIEHFLEMRHEPALVDAVAREAAAEMIVDAALRDVGQR